jgi:hypothetical protein
MKRLVILTVIPVLLLVYLYRSRRSNSVESHFNRIILPHTRLIVKDTIALLPGEIIDGMTMDSNVLWLNERFFIAKIDASGKRAGTIRAGTADRREMIGNVCADHGAIFYSLSNERWITRVDTNGNKIGYFYFDFPEIYFIKLRGSSFLFQELTIGRAFDRFHYEDFNDRRQRIDTTTLSTEEGSGMRYSGNWFSSVAKDRFFFVPFYNDTVLCFNASGFLSYRIRPIDAQRQQLKVIHEGDRFYLDPHVVLLRNAACSIDSSLLISSYVMSDKESADDYLKNLSVDVYSSSNGKYKFSFYIPERNGQKPVDFVISSGQLLYVLYDKEIVRFDVSAILTKKIEN